MGYERRVIRSADRASGRERPLGYVFMLGQKPMAPLRETEKEATGDAIAAREARVDLQYGQVFFSALAWVAPVWP